MRETSTQIRLRRAKEALAVSRDNLDLARLALSQAEQSVNNAKIRYELLFQQEEREAVARQKGQVNL